MPVDFRECRLGSAIPVCWCQGLLSPATRGTQLDTLGTPPQGIPSSPACRVGDVRDSSSKVGATVWVSESTARAWVASWSAAERLTELPFRSILKWRQSFWGRPVLLHFHRSGRPDR
jgi:hypothetical protein